MKQLLLGAIALSSLAACRGQTSKDTPVFGIRNMYDQPRYNVQEESNFFADHRTMRPLVDGVVSTDEEVDPQIARGRLEDETGYVMTIPSQVVSRAGGMPMLLERGKARYGVYCVPCHDATGSGEGLVKRRAVAGGAAAFVPPTFHQDRIRHMPDGQLFATITNGKSNMPPYAMQVKVDDRWAIVAYVRALEVAQPKSIGLATPAPTAIPGGATAMPAPGGSVPAPTPSGSAAPTPSGSGSAMTKSTGSPEAVRPLPSGVIAPTPAPSGSAPMEKHP